MIYLFGGRAILYWFGWDIKLRTRYLCLHWHRGDWWKPWRWFAYLSPDATPPGHLNPTARWIFGGRRLESDSHGVGDS